ncbi:hypothetical protein GCM10022399_05140 [Terrabacter ginsenosidimutans]|uniref:Uncharacterized protein n=1 Tax=Terrabacter ginsenosidimutans TaxID=490575 RepID=A0ABP7CNP5_9MICO
MLGRALATPAGRSDIVGSDPLHAPSDSRPARPTSPAQTARGRKGARRTAYVLSFIVTLNA